MEQRRALRFHLFAEAVCRWQDLLGQNRESVGRTRDISIVGAFVVCPSPPPVGTVVSLEIRLPALHQDVPWCLGLKAEARVARVTNTQQDRGFAATSRFEVYDVCSTLPSLPLMS